jgi:hypothetical protein
VSVFVRAFEHRAAQLQVPRTLVTPHLMGRTIGPVGDRTRQRAVVDVALELLEEATTGATVRRFAPRA